MFQYQRTAVAKVNLGVHARAALKWATLLYAAELGKAEGDSPKKSEDTIPEKVKNHSMVRDCQHGLYEGM